jgi:Lrp/AsnC family leucine-responsive transcriptional regulator
MDEIDRKIIRHLTASGRMSFAELGRRVNLSTPAVHYRVKQLEARGVITGYAARLDADAMGLDVSAIVEVEIGDSLDTIVAALGEMPEVEACLSTAGASDLLLKVRVAHPVSMERLLVRIRELPGVQRTRSTVLLATRFEREPEPQALPTEEEPTGSGTSESPSR